MLDDIRGERLEEALDVGMHLETAGEPIALSDDDGPEHVDPFGADQIDAIAAAFNARDLDALIDMCADDCEMPGLASDLPHLGESVADLWDRRPTISLTRAELEGTALGVLWELADGEWAAIGTVHVDLVDELVGAIEVSDDPALLDEIDALPPDEDLREGSTWDEWDENPDR